MSTFLTMQQQEFLVSQRLATKKVNPETGLVTYKYHRRVMYDYLWDEHPELFECRGHTYDPNTGEIVVFPPRKSFNYLENGTWEDVPLDTKVVAFKKFNGFMACLTIHNGKIIISTTGGTTGPYVKYAEEMLASRISQLKESLRTLGNNTQFHHKSYCSFLYEICHPEDPHIVSEEYGAYYLGIRYNDGDFLPVSTSEHNVIRGKTLGEILDICDKNTSIEGFMVYREGDFSDVCKIKTAYYSNMKFLMRMKDNTVSDMYQFNNKVNDRIRGSELTKAKWFFIISSIISSFPEWEWKETPEQDRRKYIETFF